MKKLIFVFILFVLKLNIIYSMDSKEFDAMISNIKQKKFELVESFLLKNETLLLKDPDYYSILLNYSLAKEISVISVSQEKPKNNDIPIVDSKTGKIAGSIKDESLYDEKYIVEAISKTKMSLSFFQSRLDIHLGVIVAAEEIKRWDLLGDEVIEILEVSKKIDNKWTWGSQGSVTNNPKEFMLDNIQSRTYKLFVLEDSKADAAFVLISKAMVRLYPEVIYGYSNLGVFCLAQKEYDKADEYLQKALKINPKDEIVLGNLGLLKKARKK